jgi:hypothetical protein
MIYARTGGRRHQHGLSLMGGAMLEAAIDRKLVGFTEQHRPEHPSPVPYVRGDLMEWLLDNLGEKSQGGWELVGDRTFGLELRFLHKQHAMMVKLLFGGHPVLIP